LKDIPTPGLVVAISLEDITTPGRVVVISIEDITTPVMDKLYLCSYSSRHLLGNKMSFTLCSIHILFISNEFYKFWMSFDFRSRCTKNGQIWAKTQPNRPGTPEDKVPVLIQWQYDTIIMP